MTSLPSVQKEPSVCSAGGRGGRAGEEEDKSVREEGHKLMRGLGDGDKITPPPRTFWSSASFRWRGAKGDKGGADEAVDKFAGEEGDNYAGEDGHKLMRGEGDKFVGKVSRDSYYYEEINRHLDRKQLDTKCFD